MGFSAVSCFFHLAGVVGCREAFLPKRKLGLGQLLCTLRVRAPVFRVEMESRWSLGWTPQALAWLPSGPQREPTALRRKGLRWHTLAVRRLPAPVSPADWGGSAPGGIPAGAPGDGRGPRPLPGSGAGGIGSAGGQPGSQLSLGSPLSVKPIRLAVRQLERLFCASLRRCEGFSLGKKSVVECLPSSNATQPRARPEAQGSRRESKFSDPRLLGILQRRSCGASLAEKECVSGGGRIASLPGRG